MVQREMNLKMTGDPLHAAHSKDTAAAGIPGTLGFCATADIPGEREDRHLPQAFGRLN